MAVTLRTLAQKKANQERITMLTCYDATFARLLDDADIDIFLVGDSLGMVVKGEDSTLNVTVEEVAYHVKSVARGTQNAHIVGDMPFMSYQVSPEQALENAATLMRAGSHSVKLEGGRAMVPVVKKLVAAGIPVMGHVGLLPQSMHAQSGFRVQGRDDESAERILQDALALERAGAYAVVLEGIPADVAVEISSQLTIPTIGIGAGVGCDGQVLVLYDLLGLNPSFKPKFVKHFLDGAEVIKNAVTQYRDEVKAGAFPGLEHSFGRKTKKSIDKPRIVEPSASKSEAQPFARAYGPVDLELIEG